MHALFGSGLESGRQHAGGGPTGPAAHGCRIIEGHGNAALDGQFERGRQTDDTGAENGNLWREAGNRWRKGRAHGPPLGGLCLKVNDSL